MAIVAEQDQVLAEMADRTREIQEATAQRREELRQLRAAREQRAPLFKFTNNPSLIHGLKRDSKYEITS